MTVVTFLRGQEIPPFVLLGHRASLWNVAEAKSPELKRSHEHAVSRERLRPQKPSLKEGGFRDKKDEVEFAKKKT